MLILVLLPPELPAHAAHPFKTSSSKKRKLAAAAARPFSARQPSAAATATSLSPSPDTALPSCELADDNDDDSNDRVAYSFTTATSVDDNDDRSVHRESSPVYLRSDSLQPASGLPARLQAAASSSTINGRPRHPSPLHDCNSAASSPSASVHADLSLDAERGIGEAGSAATILPGSQFPLRLSRLALLNGDDAELPHRSSSPLKRRASSMDPDPDASSRNGEDVSMNSSQATATATATAKSADVPRAMSVDPPEVADAPAQSKLPTPPSSVIRTSCSSS